MQIFINDQLHIFRRAKHRFLFNNEDSNAIEDAGISHLVKMKGIKLKKIFLGKKDIN
jgi:hypothetical protein